jgi:hypothetical protein
MEINRTELAELSAIYPRAKILLMLTSADDTMEKSGTSILVVLKN